MIKTFANKGLQLFSETGNTRRLPLQQFAKRITLLLTALHAAQQNTDMDQPGFHFHYLKQDGVWSVRITGNWRIVWRWDDGAHDVDIKDYH